MSETTTRIRKSADERREEIVEIAIRQFAHTGYNATSTEAIAREAGISQPYLFRLFKTKRELFLACFDVVHERVHAALAQGAAGASKGEALGRLSRAYVALLDDTDLRLFQMQSYAACADRVIQARVRDCQGQLVKLVTRLSGASPAAIWQLFAHGALLNVVASLDLAAIADTQPWAATWLRQGPIE